MIETPMWCIHKESVAWTDVEIYVKKTFWSCRLIQKLFFRAFNHFFSSAALHSNTPLLNTLGGKAKPDFDRSTSALGKNEYSIFFKASLPMVALLIWCWPKEVISGVIKRTRSAIPWVRPIPSVYFSLLFSRYSSWSKLITVLRKEAFLLL